MAYIRLSDNFYPLSERDIRNAFPNTSFATPFNPDGYAVVFATPQPTFDQYSQKCTELAPQISTKGTWEQVWQVTDLTGEELEAAQQRKIDDKLKWQSTLTLTPRQCRQQLLVTPFSEGVTGLDAVEQAISGMGKQAQIDWEFAEIIKRDYPLVVGIQALFQWTDDETDTFFVDGALL